MNIKKFFSNLWDICKEVFAWFVVVILSLLAYVGIGLVCLIPFVLSVGGICFVIWFFFECLGGVL